MAKRQGVKKIDSSEVMGEGSYVTFRPIPYSAVRDILKMNEDESEVSGTNRLETSDYIVNLVIDALVEWDWVGYDDEPLPIPTTLDEFCKTLNTFETQFLTKQLLGSVERSKN